MKQLSQQQRMVPKEIQMDFNRYSKSELELMYKYLQYDPDVLERFLVRVKEKLIEMVIKEFSLWDKSIPVYSEKIIYLIQQEQYDVIKQYLKGRMTIEMLLKFEIKSQSDIENSQKNEEKVVIVQDAIIFLFPHHLIIRFLDYLDPFSLASFSSTCKEFNQINYDILYKKFVQILYSVMPTQVPLFSPFQSIADYVNLNPNLYSHDIINQVNDNPREQVWSDIPTYQQIVNAKYSLKVIGKNFKSFKLCFLQAPRLNFCGVYSVKETYMKIGEPTMNKSYAPCVIIEYYRYVRFWPHGAVTMLTNTEKLRKEDIRKLFAEFNPATESQTPYLQTAGDKIAAKLIRGEFIVDNENVIMKTFTSTTIYTFVFRIQSNKGLSNLLNVESAYMHMIGESYYQDLKKQRNMDYFEYKHIREFRNKLTDLGNCWNAVTY